MFSILVYFLELNLFKLLWKKIIIFVLKRPCVIHSSFVKEKQQMLKKSNIPFPYYDISFFGHLGHQFGKISLTKFLRLEIVPPKFLGVL